MYKVEDFFGTPFMLALIILVLILIVSYHWRRRYLYYYASKIPGPFSFPLIGIAHRVSLTRENFFIILWNIIKENPKVFKFWLGPYLYISTTRPQDIDIILSTFLEKGSSYKLFFEQIKDSLLATTNVNMWKKNRKFINHSFNLPIINSLHDIFVNNSRHLVKTLEKTCGESETDLFTKVWTSTLDASFESLFDMDLASADLSKVIPWSVRAEQTTIERIQTLWLHLDPIWKLSAVGRESKTISFEANNFVAKVIEMKQKALNNVDLKNCNVNKKFRFLNYSVDKLLRNGHMNIDQLVQESIIMLVGGSETSAITITSVILILGMYPEIQDKVYQEVSSITDDNMDITLRDVRGFEYVQRVIKETMRLFPAFPYIARHTDRDVQSDSFTIPSGCEVLVPIIQLHRDPDLWPDPLKFDPDRFLPEEIEKRHRCAYIPFSFGSRNCIGKVYAMNQVKCFVVQIVKNFKIKTLNWKSIDDVELDYHMLSKPINYNIVMENRRQD